MRRDREIEAPEAIAPERVGAALQDDGRGLIRRNSGLHDALEERDIRLVVDAVLKRDIEGEVFAKRMADFVDVARPREEVGRVLVKRDGENAVGVVEGLLNTVAVVNVDVDVENTSMDSAWVESTLAAKERPFLREQHTSEAREWRAQYR